MDVIRQIQKFNQGRDPELLCYKYYKMSQDAFTFLRGTCHLFYENWQADSVLDAVPALWISGDLHLENFGSYKGKDGVVYYSINDFDEAVLAPCTWEIVRLLASILVAAPQLGISDRTEALHLCRSTLTAYITTLTKKTARWVNSETATGPVKDLLREMAKRDRLSFLEQRTELANGSRCFRLDQRRLLPVSVSKRQAIAAQVELWAARQPEPDFFRILDMAYRVAGTGSLGLERYVLLVQGQGSPNRNCILDLKIERASALQPNLTLPQPAWRSQAERIVNVQQQMLGVPPTFLAVVGDGKQRYVLREFQPAQGSVSLEKLDKGKLGMGDLRSLLLSLAEATAFAHLRGCGWQNAVSIADLVDFAQTSFCENAVMHHAQHNANQVIEDFKVFRAAMK
jgi:uncharacterized protein (DUF2252 family)